MACSCGNEGTCTCKTPQMINLQDEKGIVHPFYEADRLSLSGRTYVFAVSLENDDQYALLRVETAADGSELLSNIDDENEWQEIQQSLATMMN